MTGFGVEIRGLHASLCRACLGWSERQTYLGGPVGRTFLTRFQPLGWLRRQPGTQALPVAPEGARAFAEQFGRPPAGIA